MVTKKHCDPVRECYVTVFRAKLTINCLVSISGGISARCSPIPYLTSDRIVSGNPEKQQQQRMAPLLDHLKIKLTASEKGQEYQRKYLATC